MKPELKAGLLRPVLGDKSLFLAGDGTIASLAPPIDGRRTVIAIPMNDL